MRHRRTFSRRPTSAVLLVALLAGCAVPLAEPITQAWQPVASARAIGGSPVAESLANLSLTITPGSWAMLEGDSASFSSALVAVPSDCAVEALDTDWSLPGPSILDGVLNASVGPSVTFTATAPSGGLADLHAVADLSLLCDGIGRGIVLMADASVAVTPALLSTGLVSSPNPAAPGAPVVLAWALAGGVPPFAVSVAFGDGTFANLTLAGDGDPYVAHRYAAPGLYEPSIVATDALGHASSTSVGESLVIAASLTAVIDAPGPVIDRGAAVNLTVSVAGGVGPYVVTWSDTLGSVSIGPTWTIEVGAVGNITVSAFVADTVGDGYTATRAFEIVAGPLLNVSASPARGDAGVPFSLVARVGGGVAPYRIAWTVGPNGSSGTATVAAPAAFSTGATAPDPGTVWATVSVTDAEGATDAETAAIAVLAPRPALVVAVTPPVVDAGGPVTVSGAWSGGSLPVVWTALASLPVSNASAASGSLSAPGAIRWSASFLGPGNASVVLQATDAAGVTLTGNASLRVYPALTAQLSAGAASLPASTPVPLAAAIAGGQPPYDYTFSLPGTAAASGNLTAPGSVTAALEAPGPGYALVTLRVVDALGGVAVAEATVLVTPASPTWNTTPSPATPVPTNSWSAWPIGLATVAVVGGLFLWPRLRRRRPPPATPGAMGVVRRLLRDGSPLERETVAFLAEEEGTPRDRTDEAIDRWVRAGRIRVEGDAEAGELLVWVDRAPSPAAADPADPGAP